MEVYYQITQRERFKWHLYNDWSYLFVFLGIWWLLSLPASYSGEEIAVRSQGDPSPSTKRSQGKKFISGVTIDGLCVHGSGWGLLMCCSMLRGESVHVCHFIITCCVNWGRGYFWKLEHTKHFGELCWF